VQSGARNLETLLALFLSATVYGSILIHFYTKSSRKN